MYHPFNPLILDWFQELADREDQYQKLDEVIEMKDNSLHQLSQRLAEMTQEHDALSQENNKLKQNVVVSWQVKYGLCQPDCLPAHAFFNISLNENVLNNKLKLASVKAHPIWEFASLTPSPETDSEQRDKGTSELNLTMKSKEAPALWEGPNLSSVNRCHLDTSFVCKIFHPLLIRFSTRLRFGDTIDDSYRIWLLKSLDSFNHFFG